MSRRESQSALVLFRVVGMVHIYTLVCHMLRKFPLALPFCILCMTFAFGLPTLRYNQWGLASLHRRRPSISLPRSRQLGKQVGNIGALV